MTNKLFIMVGIPASGKSTWIRQEVNRLEEEKQTTAIISRDYIRFSLLKDNDDYFAKENMVFAEFIRQINEAMELGIDNVFVDATHLDSFSRHKVLSRLQLDPRTKIIMVYVDSSIDTAIKRNKTREGKARVPDNVIVNMKKKLIKPTIDEINNYIKNEVTIITV